jgi:predicted dehydrogenase
MSEKIRIGLIGCGGIMRGHAKRLLSIPEVEIVALDDISDEQLALFYEAVPEVKGLPVFSDYREMLDKVEMDAVEIATPHTLHFQQTMDCLDAGKHILLEKPMVCSVEHAHKLIAKAEEKKRVVVISYQRHYQPEFRYMRDVIRDGKLGNVSYVSALQCQEWKRGTVGKWRQDPELSGGGQLNDSGSHLVDIILWTTGLEVDELYGYIDNLGTRVDINSALSMKFKNGAQASIAVVGDALTFYEDFTIWGSEGILFYRNGQLTHCGPDGKVFKPESLPEGGNADQNLVDAILGRDIVWSPPICGLRVIELTESAWKSAEIGCAVKVESL